MTNSNPPREQFEAFIAAPPYERDPRRFPNDDCKWAWPGQYRDVEIQVAWESYRAGYAAALAAREQEPVGVADDDIELIRGLTQEWLTSRNESFRRAALRLEQLLHAAHPAPARSQDERKEGE